MTLKKTRWGYSQYTAAGSERPKAEMKGAYIASDI